MRLILNHSTDDGLSGVGSGGMESLDNTQQSCILNPIPLAFQRLETNSRQVCWLLHRIDADDQCWVLAQECYSHYVLIFPIPSAAGQDEISQRFLGAYREEVLWSLQQGGYTQHLQLATAQRNFAKLEQPTLCCAANQQVRQLSEQGSDWLQACLKALEDTPNANTARLQYCRQLNQRAVRQDTEAQVFFPIERFLGESLYRFAVGLCDLQIPGCKSGCFPNPYRTEPKLSLVR